MRSFINVGAPIKKGSTQYKDKYDRPTEQFELILDYEDKILNHVESIYKPEDNFKTFTIRIDSPILRKEQQKNEIQRDLYLYLIGFLVSFLYFVYFFRSPFFLNMFAYCLIGTSVPVTKCLVTGILRIRYFTRIDYMAILPLLAFATNNLFYIYTLWMRSGKIKAIERDFKKRSSLAFFKSFKDISRSTIMISLVFFSHSLSSIMPI